MYSIGVSENLWVLFHPVSGGADAPLQAGPFSELELMNVGGSAELSSNGWRRREARFDKGQWVLFDPQGEPMWFAASVSISCAMHEMDCRTPSTENFAKP